MSVYILAMFLVIYLSICVGLLNLSSAIKGLEKTKSFVPVVPFIYLFLLLRAFFRYLMKRDEETKYIVKGYLRFKCALIVMLYSYSEALAEIKTEKKKRPNHIKHVNYTTSVRLASKKSWSIMQCATL